MLVQKHARGPNTTKLRGRPPQLVSWCFTALSAQTGYAIEVGNVSHRAGGENKSCNKTTKEYNKPTQL